ncbi:MAG: hypothetical protein JW883_06485 [Deltaproteobacteria bacterium]|nr:hypothetical protein [Deltaproteobacteria bacterium]
MDKDELRAKIYSKIDELPMLPTVISKLLGLIDGSKSNAADLSDPLCPAMIPNVDLQSQSL